MIANWCVSGGSSSYRVISSAANARAQTARAARAILGNIRVHVSVSPCGRAQAPRCVGTNNSGGLTSLAGDREMAMIKKGGNIVQKDSQTLSLNVKDPEAHRLAQAIAKATGETMTRAVTEALRERYERLQMRDPETLAADLRAIAKRAAAHVKRPYLDHAEFLYDEHGLPK